MEFVLLKEIVIIFALSTIVNFLFTKIKVPTVIGYLLTGLAAGPHLLGLITGEHEIDLLAEIGVALLLFAIGMEFSLKHLLKIRRIVFVGGFLQVFITAAVFYVVAEFYGVGWQGSLFVGFLVALSSSALVLKLLQERSELTSSYGRTVLGILIFQDIFLVPLLLFSDLLGSDNINVMGEVLTMGIKTVAIVAMVYVGNKWLLPKLLHMIAMTRNQELFMISIFLICFSIALLTYELGMSIAFGAFLAGLMISESEYSHNAFANLIPFKDLFMSFFFVSIGMLLDLSFIVDNALLVISTVVLVLVIKTIIAGGVGFILGHTFRGTVLVGLALSQVGEFSFVLARIGFQKSIISDFYFHLFLSVAVITMAMTPFLMRAARPLSELLLRWLPLPEFVVQGLFPIKEVELPDMENHVVIIGKDMSAQKLCLMTRHFQIPHVSIVFDPGLAREKLDKGENVVYGDAVNVPILTKAHVDTAGVVIVSVGNSIPALAIIENARQLNKKAHIIVRATQTSKVDPFYKAGADEVFPEKLEIAIDLFTRLLKQRLTPNRDINRILASIRTSHLGEYTEKDTVNRPTVLDEMVDIQISALIIEPNSPAAGKSILDLNLRKQTGVTVLAVKKVDVMEDIITPQTVFAGNDIAYVLGNPEQVNKALELFTA